MSESQEALHLNEAGISNTKAHITPELVYSSPPPVWPLIQGPLAATENNLMARYVCMDESSESVHVYGRIMTFAQLLALCNGFRHYK
jgi:hypothetical protein